MLLHILLTNLVNSLPNLHVELASRLDHNLIPVDYLLLFVLQLLYFFCFSYCASFSKLLLYVFHRAEGLLETSTPPPG